MGDSSSEADRAAREVDSAVEEKAQEAIVRSHMNKIRVPGELAGLETQEGVKVEVSDARPDPDDRLAKSLSRGDDSDADSKKSETEQVQT